MTPHSVPSRPTVLIARCVLRLLSGPLVVLLPFARLWTLWSLDDPAVVLVPPALLFWPSLITAWKWELVSGAVMVAAGTWHFIAAAGIKGSSPACEGFGSLYLAFGMSFLALTMTDRLLKRRDKVAGMGDDNDENSEPTTRFLPERPLTIVSLVGTVALLVPFFAWYGSYLFRLYGNWRLDSCVPFGHNEGIMSGGLPDPSRYGVRFDLTMHYHIDEGCNHPVGRGVYVGRGEFIGFGAEGTAMACGGGPGAGCVQDVFLYWADRNGNMTGGGGCANWYLRGKPTVKTLAARKTARCNLARQIALASEHIDTAGIRLNEYFAHAALHHHIGEQVPTQFMALIRSVAQAGHAASPCWSEPPSPTDDLTLALNCLPTPHGVLLTARVYVSRERCFFGTDSFAARGDGRSSGFVR